MYEGLAIFFLIAFPFIMYSEDKVQGLWTHLGLLNGKSITAKMSEVEASVLCIRQTHEFMHFG